MDTVKRLFGSLYGDQLRKKLRTAPTIECHFEDYFTSRVHELEKKYGSAAAARPAIPPTVVVPSQALPPPPPSSSSPLSKQQQHLPPPPIPAIMKATPSPASLPVTNGLAVPATASRDPRPMSPGPSSGGGGLIAAKRPRGGRGRRSKTASSSAHALSGDEVSPGPSAAPSATAAAVAAATAKKGAKKLRKWDADGNADEDDDRVLDYSAPAPSNHDHQADGGSGGDEPSSSPSSSMVAAVMGRGRGLDRIDQKEWGRRTTNREFVLKGLGEEADAVLEREQQLQQQSGSIGGGALGGFCRSSVGGKVLTKEEIDKPLAGMRKHLLKKNVA